MNFFIEQQLYLNYSLYFVCYVLYKHPFKIICLFTFLTIPDVYLGQELADPLCKTNWYIFSTLQVSCCNNHSTLLLQHKSNHDHAWPIWPSGQPLIQSTTRTILITFVFSCLSYSIVHDIQQVLSKTKLKKLFKITSPNPFIFKVENMKPKIKICSILPLCRQCFFLLNTQIL